MPLSLTIVLSIWAAVAPLVFALVKWGTSVNKRLDAVAQWFDPESALGAQHGTLPAQVAKAVAQLDVLTNREKIVERQAAIEIRVDGHESRIRQLETVAGVTP